MVKTWPEFKQVKSNDLTKLTNKKLAELRKGTDSSKKVSDELKAKLTARTNDIAKLMSTELSETDKITWYNYDDKIQAYVTRKGKFVINCMFSKETNELVQISGIIS